MNERELSLIRALGEEFSLALGELRESFRKSLSDYHIAAVERVAANEPISLQEAMRTWG